VSRGTNPRRELARDNADVRANVDRPVPWANPPQYVAWQTEVDSRKPLAFHQVAQVCRAPMSCGIDEFNRAVAGMPMEPIRGDGAAAG